MGGHSYGRSGDDELLSEINVVPLVDICLVLLIIFMVTANYIMMSAFTVEIPEAVHAKELKQSDTVTITVTREGPVYLENEFVTTVDLKKKMKAKRQEDPGIGVIVMADKNAGFKNVVAILDLLSEVGVQRLNIAASSD